MYVPAHFAPDAALVDELLRNHGAADLVTVTEQGLVATMLPFIYVPPRTRPADSSTGRLRPGGPALPETWRAARAPRAQQRPVEAERGGRGPGDRARARRLHLARAGTPSKAEHGRVVPTWNYVTAHVYGRLVVHDDPAWTEDLVRRLTTKHEAYRDHPWSVDDAPRPFIEGQLRAIVGVELEITRIEAKAKLSQNRPAADVEGVIAGLRERGDKEMADAVDEARAREPGRAERLATADRRKDAAGYCGAG